MRLRRDVQHLGGSIIEQRGGGTQAGERADLLRQQPAKEACLQSSARIETRARSRTELCRRELKVVGCVATQHIRQAHPFADLNTSMIVEEQDARFGQASVLIASFDGKANA